MFKRPVSLLFRGPETNVFGNKYCNLLDIVLNNVGLCLDMIWPSFKGYAFTNPVGL